MPAGFNSNWKYKGASMTSATISEVVDNTVEVFVSGTRLKKNSYSMYNSSLGPTSPAADQSYPKEFAINNATSNIALTATPAYGTTVTVAKRTGVDWDGTVSVATTDSKISSFLKAEPGVWYHTMGKYPESHSTFDNSAGTFDNGSITFDQG